MAKPTLLQSLLGRPSQSYSFPEEKQYFSNKRAMFRIANASMREQKMKEKLEASVAVTSTSHNIIPLLQDKPSLNLTFEQGAIHQVRILDVCQDATPCNQEREARLDSGKEEQYDDERKHEHEHEQEHDSDEEDDEDDVFYTPNTSPRTSMLSTAPLTPVNDSPIASTTSLSSTEHSIFSTSTTSVSLSDSTRITTPLNSDVGHTSTLSDSSHTHIRRNKPRQPRPSSTYTDEDWAKDVRWLVTPPIVSHTASTKSTPTPPPHRRSKSESRHSHPPTNVPPPRPGHKPKGKGKITSSIMMNMTALLEEDEDHDPSHISLNGGDVFQKHRILNRTYSNDRPPRSSVLITAPSHLRQRVSSSPQDLSHYPHSPLGPGPRPRSPSPSLHAPKHSHSHPHSLHLTRRRSRSLGPSPSTSSNNSNSPHQTSTSTSASATSLSPSNYHSFLSESTQVSPPSRSYTPDLPSQGTAGFTSLTLPRAPPPPSLTLLGNVVPLPASTVNRRTSVLGLFGGGADGNVDLTRSGVAQTTMASVEVVRGLGRSTSGKGWGKLKELFGGSGGGERGRKEWEDGDGGPLGFTSHRKPPEYVSSGSVLVQVWAVGVDGIDGKLIGGKAAGVSSSSSRSGTMVGRSRSMSLTVRGREKERDKDKDKSHLKEGSFDGGSIQSQKGISGGGGGGKMAEVGYIPGRSFVGRVLESGWEVKDFKKGEWVVGLLDPRKCGALAQFIVVDRHRVYRVPHPQMKTTEPDIDSSPYPYSHIPHPLSSPTGSLSRSSTSASSYSQHTSTRPPSRSNSIRTHTPTPPPTTRSPSRSSITTSSGSIASLFQPQLQLPPKPQHAPLTLEELALLPLCGVPAYRAVRTFVSAFSSYREDKVEGVSPNGEERRLMGTDHEPGRRRRVLVLRGHDGIGAMAVQMLVRRGWRVSVHAPLPLPELDGGVEKQAQEMESVEDRVRMWGGEEVVFDDGMGGDEDGGVRATVRVIERLMGDGDAFDAVLDTVGGKEVWEAGERLLRSGGLVLGSGGTSKERPRGQFTTVIGDYPERPIPTAGDHFKAGLRSLRLGTGKNAGTSTGVDERSSGGDVSVSGKVGYAFMSIAQDVDWEGAGIRESIEAVLRIAMSDGVRPWTRKTIATDEDTEKRVMPFERTPELFVDGTKGPLAHGGTAVVKIVG